MVSSKDIALMAHLMRRAGFGEPREELERLVEQGYEETVEQLLRPEEQPPVDEYTFYRYHPMAERSIAAAHGKMDWLYRMVHHQVSPGGEDRPILASCIRNRPLQGGKHVRNAPPDSNVP